jgi:predicted DNA-binding transcriptional regulator AlpA
MNKPENTTDTATRRDQPSQQPTQGNTVALTATESEMLTANEVATMLAIGVRSVWRKSQDGRLPPPIKMTGSTRWSKSTIRDWIAEQAKVVRGKTNPRCRL